MRSVEWSRAATAAAILNLALAIELVAVPARADSMTTSPEQAYDLGEPETARSVGMGGALDALGVSTTSLFLNPANVALARVYHLEALGEYSPEAKRDTIGAAIVDSVLGKVAGGVSGTFSRYDPSNIHRVWTDLRGALGATAGDHFAFGATLRWLHVNQATGTGPFGPSLASGGTSDSPIFNSFTIDLGATVTVVDGLRIGVTGHNLTNPGTAVAPTTGSAGIGYQAPTWALELDGLLDFTTWGSTRGRVMAGGEVFLADRWALRAGWRYDAGTTISSPSAGVGYIDPSWSVEIGVRRDFVSDHAETLGVLSLRYFYDALGATTPADQPDSLL